MYHLKTDWYLLLTDQNQRLFVYQANYPDYKKNWKILKNKMQKAKLN